MPTSNTPQGHHPFGFSSLYRRMKCPGSYMAELGRPEKTSPEAEEGTMLHAAVWLAIRESGRLNLSREQRHCLAVCRLWLRSFRGDNENWHDEETLSLYGANGKELCFGTPDAFKFLPSQCMAVNGDFKFGFNPVDAPELNLQMAAGSAAIMQKYGDKYDLSNGVHAFIVQPRLRSYSHPGFVYRNAGGIVSSVERIIERCLKLDAPRKAGSHCTYCKAKFNCQEFGGFELAISTLNPEAITPDNIGQLVTACSQMDAAIKRAKAILKGMVRTSGGQYGNVVLKSRAGNREVSTEYRCSKCEHEWRGPQTFVCPMCQSKSIEQTGGGAFDLYKAISEYVTTDEYLQGCKPNLGYVEDKVARAMKEAGVVKTLKDGRALFNDMEIITRAESSEYLAIEKGTA
ncbi:MAG: DUF2800 domain-containing protein [Pontiellaceae bacterium]|nr:DUF2800 domain-containing protein [Pontiellaceae bacterium]MBN2786491.1 DUF2800 domain-containing protein [Pontiellaceae bacterium]